MHIYLTGFMGCGKTHWGKIWSEVFHFNFIDLDHEITTRLNKSIPDIFEKEGEPYFREIEAQVLRSIDINIDCIIACGGGTPCFHNNMEWMNERGTTVYFEATPGFLLQRLGNETETRPLMNQVNENEILFFIEKKLAERLPFYLQAQQTIDAATLSVNSFNTIIEYA